ncbi:MAG: hypothetical protein ACJA2X_000876 [Halocynthiibacter sp.]|jgi:hypothetical protein
MFHSYVYGSLLGSIVSSYLLASFLGWLIKFAAPWDYNQRFVMGAILTVFLGGLLNAFGAGTAGFEDRISNVMQNGVWYVWSQFYGAASMLGLYFAVITLFGKGRKHDE